MSDFSLSLVRKHFPQLRQPLPPSPWTVLLEQSDSESEVHARSLFESLLETALEEGVIQDAAVAETLEQSHGLWHLRESIPLAQAEEGLNIKHDISLPVSAIAAFVASTDTLLTTTFPGARLVNFGHLGDGNLHYNVLFAHEAWAQVPDPAATRAEIHLALYDLAAAHCGTFSAEHGIGALHVPEMARYKDPVELDLMRGLKRHLDPLDLFNPSAAARDAAAAIPGAEFVEIPSIQGHLAATATDARDADFLDRTIARFVG
jgi:FAD/FMN-containing dehydrogenase